MKELKKLKVHPEIASLNPRWTDEEREANKKSILENGIRVKLIVWRDKKGIMWVIDGANRFDVWKELVREGHKVKLPIQIFKGTERDALRYSRTLNSERRHLTSSQKAAIAVSEAILDRKYELREKGMRKADANDIEGDVVNFASKLAKESGTNRAYVYDCLKFAEESPDILASICKGDINIPEGRQRLDRTKAGLPPTPPTTTATKPTKAESGTNEGKAADSGKAAKGGSSKSAAKDGGKDETTQEAHVPEERNIVDALGEPVKKAIQPIFEAVPEFNREAAILKAVETEIKRMAAEPGGDYLRVNELTADLRNLRKAIMDAMPHATCPTCNGSGRKPGVPKDLCPVCKGSKFLDRLQWRLFAKESGKEAPDEDD